MEPEVRYYFYDLFFSMLVREPPDTVIDAWAKGLAVVRESDLPESLRVLAAQVITMLNQPKSRESIRNEFMHLFWSPEGPKVSLLASHYVDGAPFGAYLVRLRSFLERTPFRKTEDYLEPEDSLAFHLDLMRSFIYEECAADCLHEKKRWRGLQYDLMNTFMSAWIFQPLREMRIQEGEPFYPLIAEFLLIFLQMDIENVSGFISS